MAKSRKEWKQVIYMSLTCIAVLGWSLALWSQKTLEVAVGALEEARLMSYRSSICEPIYVAVKPGMRVRLKGWVPSLELTVDIYRSEDLRKVEKWIQSRRGDGGKVVVYEERGVKERRRRVIWHPKIKQ